MSINTLLGIDFGFKRIGIATGQTITRSTSALTTLPNEKHNTNWDGINKVIHEWKPDVIVIGLPINKDGTDHAVTKAVRKVARALEETHTIPVHFQDERLSSNEAENVLKHQRATGARKKKVQKTDIDQLAAALILQRWLDENT